MAEKKSKGSECMMCSGTHSWHRVSPLRLLILFLLLMAAFWIGMRFERVTTWNGYYAAPMMRSWGYPGYYMGPGMMGPWYVQQIVATSSAK